MKLESDSERAEVQRLRKRTEKCVKLCQEMGAIDPNPNCICGQEAYSLSALALGLRNMVETGRMRNSTCFRLLDLILDLQESAVSDRKAELGLPLRGDQESAS